MQIFAVIAHAVCINSINIKEKIEGMKQIRTKNKASILGIKIKWIG